MQRVEWGARRGGKKATGGSKREREKRDIIIITIPSFVVWPKETEREGEGRAV